MRLTCGGFFTFAFVIRSMLTDVSDLLFHPNQDILYLLIFSIASIKTDRGRTHFQHEGFYIKQEKKGKYLDNI